MTDRVACMATFPGREEVRDKAIESLLPQVDVLWVYCNQHHDVPAELPGGAVGVLGPDIGDAGKFWAVWNQKSDREMDFFFCDDDLIYPPHYCDTMVKYRAHCGRSAVSAHGARLTFPFRNYRTDRDVRRCLDRAVGIRAEHMIGTGVMHFRTSDVELRPEDFETGDMADVWFALLAQRQKLPLRSIPHSAGWLKLAEPLPADTLWKRARREGFRRQLAALRRCEDWQLY